MCFPMYSPIVITNKIISLDVFLGHESTAKYGLDWESIANPINLNIKHWLPEWNWVKRWSGSPMGLSDNMTINARIAYQCRSVLKQTYAWQESQELQSINPPDWVKQSTLKELDALIEEHFPNWHRLYEAFRRTDNLLPRNKDVPTNEICPRSFLLIKAKQLLPNSHIIWDEGYRPIGGDSTVDISWDAIGKLGKNPDNLIPVWRD